MKMDEKQANNSEQLPQLQQPSLPSIQLQIPSIATPQQPVTNTQTLLESLKDFVTQGNKAEEKVALQIILISSAILAIISGIGLSSNGSKISIAAGILLILAIIGLGVSLVAGVMHFISERKFWY